MNHSFVFSAGAIAFEKSNHWTCFIAIDFIDNNTDTPADGNYEKMVIRTCALDSGTLTLDTELVRMSHCGSFVLDGRSAIGSHDTLDKTQYFSLPSLRPTLTWNCNKKKSQQKKSTRSHAILHFAHLPLKAIRLTISKSGIDSREFSKTARKENQFEPKKKRIKKRKWNLDELLLLSSSCLYIYI